jgi:hypothetical protein
MWQSVENSPWRQRVSICSASEVTLGPAAIGPTAPDGTSRAFLLPGTTRAGIIPWHHCWPGKQAGGEKGVSVGAKPAARTNPIHLRARCSLKYHNGQQDRKAPLMTCTGRRELPCTRMG